MRYQGRVYRPPSEADAFILQATLGCSWNHCTYCDMYRDKTFRVRPLPEILEDGENDLPMFAWAGTAIAMGNAPASVQAACTWTTASCEEAGVALAIDRLLAERWVSQENALGEVHKS